MCPWKLSGVGTGDSGLRKLKVGGHWGLSDEDIGTKDRCYLMINLHLEESRALLGQETLEDLHYLVSKMIVKLQ